MDDVKALQQFVAEYQRCLNGGDLKGFAELFAADIVWMAANMPDRVGLPELLAAQSAIFHKFNFEFELIPTEVSVLDDRWAIIICLGQGQLIPKEAGRVIEVTSRELYLLRKAPDGRWQMTRHIDIERQTS